MAEQNMSGMPGMAGMGDPTRAKKNTDSTKDQQGMDTPAPPLQTPGPDTGESMLNMPMLKPKRVWTVTGTEDWAMLRGFGKAAGMVAMMNGMMVGGGPMQNMKMGKMDMAMAEMPAPTPEEARLASDQTPTTPAPSSVSGATVTASVTPDPAVVGDNTLAIAVTGADGRPVTGFKMAATVAMVTMDMGTTHPTITETGDGHYTTKVNFSMAGPWRVVLAGGEGAQAVKQTLDFQAGGKVPAAQTQPSQAQPSAPAAGPLTLAAALASPKAGGNTMTVTVMDAAGRPMTGARVTAVVAMVTMDMGTTHPAFKDIGGGRYQGRVTFGMAGPWRVTVTAVAAAGKQQTQTFDFTAN